MAKNVVPASEFLGIGDPKVKLVGFAGKPANNRAVLKVELIDPTKDEVIGKGKVGTWEFDALQVDEEGYVDNFVLSANGKYLLNPESFGRGMDDDEFGVDYE